MEIQFFSPYKPSEHRQVSPAFYIIGFLTINIDTLSGNTFIERNLEFEREE